MPYWRLFYHIVFATKNREPLITPDIEDELHSYLTGKATALGAIVYAVNGIEDHVHVIASVPPKIALSDFIGQVKGAASHHINHLPGRTGPLFDWQRGYGVLSFGQKQLDWVASYARDQKMHHRDGTVVAVLERVEAVDDGPMP
ncbi:MAG: IS200/IS605 family transposase [Anaerolineae bacterium]|nr:IS200/IS605 family transposase [Anaerolineae bacterium]